MSMSKKSVRKWRKRLARLGDPSWSNGHKNSLSGSPSLTYPQPRKEPAPTYSRIFPQASLPSYEVSVEKLSKLLEMLSHARPHDDPWTDYFGGKYILKELWELGHKAHVDIQKNVMLRIGESRTLFSCHYDTCHRKGGFQKLEVDEKEGLIWKNDGECLGADDGGGIWVLLEMIRAKKPGLYIFHNGEERGCIGSRYIAEKNPKLLTDIDRAVAFDRRGVHSIITQMSPGVTCSQTFAKELAKRLKMRHEPDPTGTMTDTGRYIKLVPEVTNVSVGYMNEHGPRETLDFDYLFELCERLVDADFETLPIVRKPTEYDYPRHVGGVYGGFGSTNPNYRQDADGVWRYHPPEKEVGSSVSTKFDESKPDKMTLKDWLIEEYGVSEVPDPKEEPADFVQLALEVLSTVTPTDEEYELMSNALYAYCEMDPAGAKKDLLGLLEQ